MFIDHAFVTETRGQHSREIPERAPNQRSGQADLGMRQL